ncbi:MAG: 8-amino-7-oxononanoate synthase [Solirubrobacterales bacterium]|nr:8-amino-7-oxononanoate synthase [Solirubrobacterales bacterium]
MAAEPLPGAQAPAAEGEPLHAVPPLPPAAPDGDDLAAILEDLRERGLHRRMRVVTGPQGSRVVLDGRPVLLLCSNNYLGLADHPRVREAAADAAMRWGAGAGASRLVSGTMTVHRRLEEALAAFKRTEAAVLFGSGYLANLGVVGALARAGQVVFSDELNHASIIDGCRLARADVFVYDHRDVEHLAWGLRKHDGRGGVIVTDSVFSMDGDVAPLEEIVALARRHGLRTVVDEAHGTGCLGPGGRGAVAEAGLDGEVDVVIGTLGKALGAYGAFAACSARMREYLVNSARSLIFSTALPPPAAAGALAALELLVERPAMAATLQANAAWLRDELAREGFEVAGSSTQIVPLVVGDAALAMRMCEEAIQHGVFAQAIRPPTVAPGTSRLRLAVMATHTRDELRQAARTLGRAALRAGFRPGAGLPVAAAQPPGHPDERVPEPL